MTIHYVFFSKTFYLHERVGADWRERSVLPAEAKPPLGDFVGAPVIRVIVWEVPRVSRRLDDGVVAGDTLFTAARTVQSSASPPHARFRLHSPGIGLSVPPPLIRRRPAGGPAAT